MGAEPFDPAAVPVQRAASVLLVDDRPDLHVLCLRRRTASVFVGGMTVFPGGGIDDHDDDAGYDALLHGRGRAEMVDRLGVDDALEAEAVAALAGAVRRVEGEDPRLDLGQRRPAVEAGELLAEDEDLAALAGARPRQDLRSRDLGGAIDELDLDEAIGESDRRLDRFR